jgi:hypothetical protein
MQVAPLDRVRRHVLPPASESFVLREEPRYVKPYGWVASTFTAPVLKRTHSWVFPKPLSRVNSRARLAMGAGGVPISPSSYHFVVYTLPAAYTPYPELLIPYTPMPAGDSPITPRLKLSWAA